MAEITLDTTTIINKENRNVKINRKGNKMCSKIKVNSTQASTSQSTVLDAAIAYRA